MKSDSISNHKSITSPSLIQFVRKIIFSSVIFAFALAIFCMILGWRTPDSIGTGFIYGSLGLLLFGILTLFGNTVPTQLSKLSLPKYSSPSTKPPKETEIDGRAPINRGKELFFTALICGALIFLTGFILRML